MNTPTRSASAGIRVLLSVVCVVFFTIGAAFGYYAYLGIREARESLQWPTTPGRITQSGVDVSISREHENDSRRRRETRSYSAHVAYEYTVEGKTYTGERIAVVTDQFGSHDWAKATTEKFPVGREVTVSYHPEHPEQCVLEPGRWGGAGIMLIVAGVFGFFPPLVLKAIWTNKPVPTGLHPETRSQRILDGCEYRERILTWKPGQLVHLQRDSISLLSVIGGAVVAGLVLGLLFGLTPALFFFAGRGPFFIGQFYLGASLITALVAGVWLWQDSRFRETRIDWETRRVQWKVGSRTREASFSDVSQVAVEAPEPSKSRSAGSGQESQTIAVRVYLNIQGKAVLILESESKVAALKWTRKQASSIARQLSLAMEVPY
ncbi:MAG: DUF3592 domain-containing protein [Pirellulales bacterium]